MILVKTSATYTFCFAFSRRPMYSADSKPDGTSDRATTLLDLQRRPAPLPLGYAFRKRQRDVARRRRKAGRNPRAETGAQGGPRAVLSLRAGEVALFDCGSDARPVSGSARRQGKKSGGRPAGVRTAAAAGGARGAAGESRAAEDEIAEERAGADFFDHRRGVSGDFADVGNCGHAGNSAAVDCTRESARKSR